MQTMFIVHVTPIIKGGIDHLSYFSPQEIPVGTVVYVPLRNKEVPALVLKREDARAIKSILRTNVYETRKIKKQKPVQIFSAEFVRAAQATAIYSATSVSNIIQSYVPAAILGAAEENLLAQPSSQNTTKTTFEKLILQLPRRERIEKYKTIIRSNFAQGNSVFLCVPTVREARFFKEQYCRGIEEYTFLLESSQSKKKQVENWNSVLQTEHPVLIVATPTYASIPRGDVGMFILEHETSSAYKQLARPRADARILVEHIARETKSSLVYAGTTVSLRVHKELKEGLVHELEEHSRKLREGAAVKIIDSKSVRREAKESKGEFPVLAPQTLDTLSECVENRKHSFIFTPRRGIASHTICNDCNSSVLCHHCASPIVLHERNGKRQLLCHRCGSIRDAHETCATCDSWNLMSLGVGIERVEQYLTEHLSTATIFTLSSDTAKTPTQAKKIITDYYATPGSVLIGTEMALSYLTEKVEQSVISSIDALMCIPDFHIEEKIFGIIAALREHTNDTLLIETTNTKNSMLKHAKGGSIEEYAQEELVLREKLHYPPYTQLIKVTCRGTRNAVINDIQKFVEHTKAYKPRVFAGFIPKQREHELHALIRIPAKNWPSTELIGILTSLPHSFTVDVNPERTL